MVQNYKRNAPGCSELGTITYNFVPPTDYSNIFRKLPSTHQGKAGGYLYWYFNILSELPSTEPAGCGG